MSDEIYADGVGEITITGSIVRIDFVSLSPEERDQNNNPKAVFRQRVIMPVDAFANSMDLLQKALNGLVEAGAIRRVADMPKAPVAEIGREAASAVNASPNFN
ncbi:hypothetical protein SAMN02745157_1418 [Kaistia soli DSM 19436]|uniref:Uncharacterized protein n=1 Tax=Kaistia soli DSM 19436 TaxID=1122133 RepID=A0A1M4Y3W5_9HYPH|nr:hypothetical protein [Kaistia soli]SHF00507.1 hypothetical protein SAMN02745157_1418 [Kaistia soli DSM 19436]